MLTETMRFCRSTMVPIAWILLVGGWVVEAQIGPNCGSLEFVVPRDERAVGDDCLVKVTYSHGQFENNVLHDEVSGTGATFLHCCEWPSPDSTDQRTARTLNCNSLADLNLHRKSSPKFSAKPDFCLRVNSSLNSYIVANSDGKGKDQGCALRADAAMALLVYLKWFWLGSLSESRIMNRLSSLASVHTQAECSSNAPCRLTISARWEASSSSTFLPSVLGAVEWIGSLSNKRNVLQLQEYEVALNLSPGIDDPHMHSSPKKTTFETKVFDFSLSNVSPASFQLGRRSLQARAFKGAGSHAQWAMIITGTLISFAGVSMLAILCAGKKEDESPGEFLDTVPILPPRFAYSKLQKATKSFSQKLGDGAFGSVYEGTLPNGIRVAVKMLEKASVQGEKQFRAEVASMGAIRHLNLVRLHGFCSEGAHRLLVYEYMPNGSLDSWLFGKKQGEKLLDWEQRLNIALGTARALAYLHEECSDHIIHLDVKPENILLDHQFCPKLSDFGLAKLMDREQSRVVTSMRGTPGYLAPEWLLPHAAVTAKTDVYSFGMVLLELISGRENTNFSLGKEQWYFPAWAFKLMGESRTMELLDKRLHVEEVEYFHKEDAVRAIHVALLCIQDDPHSRPAMSRVVHMLQGHVEPEPLNARQSAIQPPRRLVTAFAASVCDANPSNAKLEFSGQNHHHEKSSDSRKNSWSNEHAQPHGAILSDLMKSDMHNDHYAQRNDGNLHRGGLGALGGTTSARLPVVSESPSRVLPMDTPKTPPRMSPRRSLEELEKEKDHFKLEPEQIPAAIQVASQYRNSNKADRMAGAHHLGSNPKCIPPWPVQGDVILLRGPHGDFHGVVRDVRVHSKQMRLGLLHRLSSETRWSVREEESAWRHWNESIRTLDFWVVVRWATVPGRGYEKFPVEWQVK